MSECDYACVQDGSCVLYAAARGGLSDLAKELIAAGLDIHHKNKVRVRAIKQIEMLANFGPVFQHANVCACSMARPRCMPLLGRAILNWQKSLSKMVQISTTNERCA